MTKRSRRNHSPAFKSEVALAAVRGEKTLTEMDVTYIPMARGFVYLAAVMDWFSRIKRSASRPWRRRWPAMGGPISQRDAEHRRDNTDQGSQFTSAAFTGLLLANSIKISMDGKGAWRDNVFVERLWRSVKYEEVYLHAYDSVADAGAGIGPVSQLL
jgi:putative transposase